MIDFKIDNFRINLSKQSQAKLTQQTDTYKKEDLIKTSKSELAL